MKKASHNLKKLATNSFFSCISEISIALLFLLFILAARYLGDEEFGIFSFALAFVSIFGIINDSGLRYLFVKDVSRDKALASEYLGNMLSLQICLSVIGLGLIITTINLLGKSPETRTVVYILAGAEILRSAKMFFRFVFRALDRFELESITVFLERGGLLLVGMAVLMSGFGVIWFACAFLIVRLCDLILTLIFIRKLTRLKMACNFPLWVTFLKHGFPFALTGVVILIMLRIDTIMISLFRNNAEVGWYNAGYKLIEGAAFIPSILSNTLLPSVSRLHKTTDAVAGLYERGMKYVFLISIPLVIIGFVLADKLILFVFGQDYVQATIVFKILLWSLLFTFAIYIGGSVLGGIGKQKTSLYVATLALFVNLSLNAFLIPQKGYVGAAVTTVISEFIFCLLIGWSLFSCGYKINYMKLILKPLLAASTVAAIIITFPASLGLTLPLAIAGYFGIITLLSYWDAEEILLIKEMANSIRAYLIPV